MTYAANQKNLVSYVSYSPPQRNAIVKKVGILWRIFGAVLDAMHESRRRQAEREIAKFVALRGGPITDDFEREMVHRHSSGERALYILARGDFGVALEAVKCPEQASLYVASKSASVLDRDA